MTPDAKDQQWPDEVTIQPAGAERRAGAGALEAQGVNLAEASLPSSRFYLDASGEVPTASVGDWQEGWIEDA